MYIDFLNALSLRQLKQPVNMCVVAVHAAVRHKTHQVQSGIIFLHILACCKERLILKEISVLDGFRDLCQILIHDASCAHVQVSYLRVSHLSVRKPDSHAAGISLHKRALSHQFVHDRCRCLSDRIPMLVISQAVAV